MHMTFNIFVESTFNVPLTQLFQHDSEIQSRIIEKVYKKISHFKMMIVYISSQNEIYQRRAKTWASIAQGAELE